MSRSRPHLPRFGNEVGHFYLDRLRLGQVKEVPVVAVFGQEGVGAVDLQREGLAADVVGLVVERLPEVIVLNQGQVAQLGRKRSVKRAGWLRSLPSLTCTSIVRLARWGLLSRLL
jgi:hypothetical protein